MLKHWGQPLNVDSGVGGTCSCLPRLVRGLFGGGTTLVANGRGERGGKKRDFLFYASVPSCFHFFFSDCLICPVPWSLDGDFLFPCVILLSGYRSNFWLRSRGLRRAKVGVLFFMILFSASICVPLPATVSLWLFASCVPRLVWVLRCLLLCPCLCATACSLWYSEGSTLP